MLTYNVCNLGGDMNKIPWVLPWESRGEIDDQLNIFANLHNYVNQLALQHGKNIQLNMDLFKESDEINIRQFFEVFVVGESSATRSKSENFFVRVYAKNLVEIWGTPYNRMLASLSGKQNQAHLICFANNEPDEISRTLMNLFYGQKFLKYSHEV